MARDNSLIYSIKDNGSASLIKITENMQKNRKEIQNLSGKIDELNKKKATLTVDAAKAKNELKDAKKAFDDTEESAKRLSDAQLNYDNLTQELRSVTQESKAAEKQINALNDSIERNQNRAGSILAAQKAAEETQAAAITSEPTAIVENAVKESLLSKLGQAGATQLIGQVASEAAGAYISSAFGTEASTMFSSVLGMGASGAAIGSMFGPAGTAIGAGVGGLLGAVSGATQNFQNRDEYFKSLVQDQYNQYQEDVQNSLTSGSTTAASQEQSQLAFTTLLGDANTASQFLSDLQDFSAVTPFSRSGLEAISKALIANGFKDLDEQMTMMTAVGEAGSALGLSEESMAEAATYLGRMNSTGKASLEYLTPLIERGIPAVDYLAENLGKSREEVYEMVSDGLIPGAEAARVIAAAMGEDFAGSMEAQAQTYTGLMSTLSDAREQLDAAMGEGYNEARKPAIQEEIDYLSGEGGEQMKEMYSLIGEFQASLENAKEEAIRNAMIDVQDNSLEYQQAKAAGDGAKMGELLAEAKAQAEKEYMESTAYQTMIESQTSTIERVRNTMADSYWEAGYELMNQFNQGVLAAGAQTKSAIENGIITDSEILGAQAQTSPESKGIYFNGKYYPQLKEMPSHASGLMYVPYNDYPARLHEGEQVLTAREARERKAGNGNVTVSVNGNLVVREEADIDRIAETIARKVVEARELLV